MRLAGSFTLLLLAVAARAEDIPALRPIDAFPKAWWEVKVDAKPTWDETWTAGHNEQAWKQALEQDEAIRPAADRLVVLKTIGLREELLRLFPGKGDPQVEAYFANAAAYKGLDDRLRAAQWFKKAIEDFPEHRDVPARACTGILECGDPFDALPGVQAWVAYVAQEVEALKKAGAIPADHPVIGLARQRAWLLQQRDGRYEDARRALDLPDNAEPAELREPDRLALLVAAGHVLPAAVLCETGSQTNAAKAAELRAAARQGGVADTGKVPSMDLTMRMEALLAKRRAGESPLKDTALVQESLNLGTESGAMWSPAADHRISCRLLVERMLRDLPPAELQPLSEIQERDGGALARELSPAAEDSEWLWLAQRYPWSASVNARLVEFGEACLWKGRWNQASRAFLAVAEHSGDAAVAAQANLGLCLAMAAVTDSREALEPVLASIPDGATLQWRGQSAPAADVKKAVRESVTAGAAAAPALGGLRRAKLRLPAAMTDAAPLPLGTHPAPRGLGALAINRIEPAGNDLFVIGPQHVACYRASTLELRWVQAGNPAMARQAGDAESRAGADADRWPLAAWRPVVLGGGRSRAVSASGPALKGGSIPGPGLVYGLMSYNLRSGTTSYDLVAFDAQRGLVRWRTGELPDWSGLEPLGDPAVAEGRAYVVARGAGVGGFDAIYLIALDAQTGATVWKSRLGYAPADGERQELARRASGVTLHQGALYVATNQGLLARCDPRDGNVEWVRGYASAIQTGRLHAQFQRDGASPLVVGERLLTAPRDHSGVMALDRRTGDLLWETLLVPSEEVLGAVGSVLVVRDGDELSGLNIESGKEIWTRAVDVPTGAPALVAGQNVVVLSRQRLLRIAAASGSTVEELALNTPSDVELALLPDGTLVEVSGENAPAPAAGTELAAALPRLPMAADWALPSRNPLLVLPVPEPSAPAVFGVLSGRSFQCVRTQPRCGVAWRSLLRDGADSVGFHGDLVIAARGRELTALNVADGLRRWSLELPFDAQVVGGDARVVFAGERSKEAKVAAIDPKTGKTLWIRWFGQEARFGQAPLKWISLRQPPSEPPSLILYFATGLVGKEGWRPACVAVDARSGAIQDVARFMPDEPEWPTRIVFGGGGRTHAVNSPFFYGRPSLVGLSGDAIAWVGQGAAARFLPGGQGFEPALDWKHPVNLEVELQYPGAIGLHVGASGAYVKQLQQLFFFDAASSKEITYEIPKDETRTECTMLDLRELGDVLMTVSGEAPRPPKVDARRNTHGGLKADNGKGDVTLHWFSDVNPQIHIGTRGLPEAGTCAVTTLLNGNTKEHYVGMTFTVSGLSSLGWGRYDVFVYGLAGEGLINGQDRQVSRHLDDRNRTERTTLIRGVNYMKFAGVSGDAFTFSGSQAHLSGVQIVDASTNAAAGGQPASLSVCWDGGGVGLGPNDRVGAEVEAGCWYNIGARHELRGGYQAPVAYVDAFNRKTGALIQTQPVPVVPRDYRHSSYDPQAAILDDALLVTDAQTVYILRNAPQPSTPAAAAVESSTNAASTNAAAAPTAK